MASIRRFLVPVVAASLAVGILAGFVTRTLPAHPRELPAKVAPKPAVNPPRSLPEATRPLPTDELAGNLQDLFSTLADRIRPAVVSISSTEVAVPRGAGHNTPPFFRGDPWAARKSSLGSGVIVDPRGYIVTNGHVVGDDRKLTVHLWNNQRLPARLVERDDTLDVALVKVDQADLVAIPLGSSSSLRVGHWVVAVGSPFGLDQTVSAGIVSAVGRSDIGILPHESFIQTDANIHVGNSGGPLVNLRGEIVGINAAVYSNSHGSHLGIGFAIPIDLVKGLIGKWIAGKKAISLGVSTRKVDAEVAAYYGLEGTAGAFVNHVDPGSDGDHAGLLAKDIVLAFDGTTVRDADHFRMLLHEADGGRSVEVEVLRRNQRLTLVAELALADSDVADASASVGSSEIADARSDLLGITVTTVTDEIARRLGFPEGTPGIVVLNVRHDSPADEKGIRVGDVIRELNDVEVTSIEDFGNALDRSPSAVMLRVDRDGREAGYFFLRR